MPTTAAPRFLAQLEGLRAVAALGVLITHVGFQTGLSQRSVLGAIVARFDYFVAIFFALSAFLLWRNFRREGYYLRRAARILPAYWVLVAVSLALVPASFGTSPQVGLTTLTFTQIYFPDHLAGGLTHLWSLSVEVAFYVALPVLYRLAHRAGSAGDQGRRRRIAFMLALGCLGLAWAGTPWPDPGTTNDAGQTFAGVNFQIYPLSYLPWFAVGMIVAELEGRVTVPAWWRRVAWPVAAVICWVAGQEWFGPLGLVHPSPLEFVRRILGGTLFAAVLLVPYALGRPDSDPGHRRFGKGYGLLSTPALVQVGTWSYSIFLWHLPVLSFVLPVAGINLFSGSIVDFVVVAVLTVALSIVVAWISYEWVEKPARDWIRAYLRSKPGAATASA